MAERWYSEGLRFECTRCGHCCTGEPGAVRVGEAEIAALAARTRMSEGEFRRAYTRALPNGAPILRESRGGACVFFDPAHGCRVYEDRPLQCRTWPFWRKLVATRSSWNEQASACPGMNRGALHAAEEIEALSAHDGTSADPTRCLLQPPPRPRS